MNNIQKVGDIQYTDIADYLRLIDVDSSTQNYLNLLILTSINYIKNYTGITDLDSYPDFVIVVFVLCQDMYDNRTLYVDNANVNLVVQSILDMHSTNLLPSE